MLLCSSPRLYPGIYFEIEDTPGFEEIYRDLKPAPGVYSIYHCEGTFDIEVIEHKKIEQATLIALTHERIPCFHISVLIPDDILRYREDAYTDFKKETENCTERDDPTLCLHHVEKCDAFLGFPYHPIANDWVVGLFCDTIKGTPSMKSITESDLSIEIRLLPGSTEAFMDTPENLKEKMSDIRSDEDEAGVRMGAMGSQFLFGSLLDKETPLITVILRYAEWKEYLMFHADENANSNKY